MSTIRAQRYKKIIENRPFFTKKLSIILLKEKGQRTKGASTFLHLTSYIFLLPSYFLHQTSSFRHLTSFRTTPVPFNLEEAPPLSCILPPQGEENRSACRSYIKVSADHQRSGFFCALRQGQRSKAGQGSMRLCRGSRFNGPLAQFKVKGYLLLLTSDIILQTSSFRHLTSFRTTPVPFNLEGAPPLSCILPPQGEENRSACRSYIKVSADHQRSGFFCALRQGQRSKGLSPVQGSRRLCRGSRFKVQGSLT